MSENGKAYFDTIVVGGGTSGVAAAMAAAEKGGSVLVIERGFSLGGAATAGQVTPRMATHVPGFMTHSLEMINEMAFGQRAGIRESWGSTRWFNPELMKTVYDGLLHEKNVRVLFGATFVGCTVSDGSINCLTAVASGKRLDFAAKTYIDSTGDALLAKSAGVFVESGDENGVNQNVTLRFSMSGVNIEKLRDFLRDGKSYVPMTGAFEFAYVSSQNDSELKPFFDEALEKDELTDADVLYIQAFINDCYGRGTVYFNCPEAPLCRHSVDPFELSGAVAACRASAVRLSEFFIKYFRGFENAFISSFADYPGIRDGYRIKGKYILTDDDYIESRKFESGIAQCAYPIDIHGAKKLNHPPRKDNDFFEIPFEALVTSAISNLIVTGRCISATFTAQSSIRIQEICIATGEAAGLAAAIANCGDKPVSSLDGKKIREAMQEYGTVFVER